MRILLLGEYSNFHSTLKTGLEKNGHRVLLSGRNDGFKGFKLDISLEPKLFAIYPFRKLKNLIYLLFKFDISCFEVLYNFFKNKNHFKGYDFVQLINEFPLKTTPYFDTLILKFIFKHNRKVILSACGDDVTYINYVLSSNLPHHVLTPFQENLKMKPYFKHSLNYLKPTHKKLSAFVKKNVSQIIPGDYDYEMAYQKQPKVKPLIPFPVNIDKIKFTPLDVSGKIKIFHGINRINYYKKGNNHFCEALKQIQTTYKERIEIIEVESIPYKDYIKLYNASHILLDQTHAYDQGYNALEAMAQGKVVFSGFSDGFKSHYNITKTIGIHTTPDVEAIVKNLSWLIENPKEIIKISENARAYIETYHNYSIVAQTYLETWES